MIKESQPRGSHECRAVVCPEATVRGSLTPQPSGMSCFAVTTFSSSSALNSVNPWLSETGLFRQPGNLRLAPRRAAITGSCPAARCVQTRWLSQRGLCPLCARGFLRSLHVPVWSLGWGQHVSHECPLESRVSKATCAGNRLRALPRRPLFATPALIAGFSPFWEQQKLRGLCLQPSDEAPLLLSGVEHLVCARIRFWDPHTMASFNCHDDSTRHSYFTEEETVSEGLVTIELKFQLDATWLQGSSFFYCDILSQAK